MQLTPLNSFDASNIVFSKALEKKIPKSTMQFYRIPMNIKHPKTKEKPEGGVGKLVVPFGSMFSFGVQENKSLETGKLTGYSMSLALYSRDGPTEEEKKAEKMVTDIVGACKAHMLKKETKIEVRMPELVESDLRKMDPIYRKRDKETLELVPDASPYLYPKLIAYPKKENKNAKAEEKSNDNELDVKTIFFKADEYNKDGTPAEYTLKEMLGMRCTVKSCAIIFDNIYVGSGKVRLQFKLLEADVRKDASSNNSLLRQKRPSPLGDVQLLKDVLPQNNDGLPSAPMTKSSTTEETLELVDD